MHYQEAFLRPSTEATSNPNERSEGYYPIRMSELVDLVAPSGYILLDEAMNRAGVALAPADWGRTAGWIPHPYRYEKKSRELCRFSLSRTKDGFWEIVRAEAQSPFRTEKLLQYASTYQSVVQALSHALQAGQVRAVALSALAMEEIPQVSYATQMLAIFYCGMFLRPDSNTAQPVAIELFSFETWLRQLDRARSRNMSESLRDGIVEALVNAAGKHAIRYQRRALGDQLRESFSRQGIVDLPTVFEDRIWPRLNAVKFPPGRTPTADVELMKSKLQWICDEIAEWRKGFQERR